MPQAALIGTPGVETAGRLAHGPLSLGIGNGRGNGDGYRLGDLVLHRENVGEVPVVALRSDLLAGLRLDQLRRDADTITGLA